MINNPLNDFKAEVVRLWHTPPLSNYTPRIEAFWGKYGFKIKLGSLVILIIAIVALGISLGLNLAAQNRLKNVNPPPITLPTVSPTPIATSRFESVLNKIKAFSTLLPDPAPPTVDENIRFSDLPDER